MISLDEFAAVLDRAAKVLPEEIVVGTKEIVEAVAIEARSYIGHYQTGWAPLREATLYGGTSPSGHRYAGKIALGYSPPDNPLLREGHLQASIHGVSEPLGDGALGVVGSTDRVAIFQELGTSEMVPRPFLGLAMSRAEPVMVIAYKTVFQRAFGVAP